MMLLVIQVALIAAVGAVEPVKCLPTLPAVHIDAPSMASDQGCLLVMIAIALVRQGVGDQRGEQVSDERITRLRVAPLEHRDAIAGPLRRYWNVRIDVDSLDYDFEVELRRDGPEVSVYRVHKALKTIRW